MAPIPAPARRREPMPPSAPCSAASSAAPAGSSGAARPAPRWAPPACCCPTDVISRCARASPCSSGSRRPWSCRSPRTTASELRAAAVAGAAASSQTPTFYRDVLPILQQHCQACHRPGEIAPFPLVAYADARSHATAIAKATGARAMPPWFADPGVGRFKNDPSLSAGQIHTLAAWAAAGMPAGDPRDAPPPRRFTRGWNIDPPQTVVRMPVPVRIPARGQLDYTYEIVPTGFAAGRWVQEAEIRPSSRSHVHHAVVYVRPQGSPWLQGAPLNRPFTARDLGQRSLWTDSEILLVYAPGSAPDR